MARASAFRLAVPRFPAGVPCQVREQTISPFPLFLLDIFFDGAHSLKATGGNVNR